MTSGRKHRKHRFDLTLFRAYQIASLRKSNAALRAAVNDNELAADETDAALERAVTDCENSVLQLRTVEAELDEANAEQETTAVELDICQQQVDDLLQRARAMAVEVGYVCVSHIFVSVDFVLLSSPQARNRLVE